ncbi:MAG: zinc ABC transporter solute-binding protein [Muribaculaceae bacterium]|nr:zinc ABC transporter solute-binding protein [Muribaculaceae bacterium]
MKSSFNIFLIISGLLLALGIVAACTSAPSESKIVTVSIEPQKYLLEQITGDRVEVRCLLANGANPETYDPSVTHLMNLQKSMGFLRMGNIGFESALLDKIHQANPELPIYNTSDGISLITGTHSHNGVIHGDVDPHTWSSVKNAKVITKNMLDAMIEIDPANKAYYQRNYTRFASHLDSLDNAITAKLAHVHGKAFLVWHPSLSYFARDYGLEQVVVGNAEHKDVALGSLREVVEHAREHEADIFFTQKDFDSRQVSAINSQIGAREVSINPMAYEWENEMLTLADALASK